MTLDVDILIKKPNECYFQLIFGNPDIKEKVIKYFSIHEEGYQHSNLFKLKLWDGYRHFFSEAYNILAIGLAPQLKKFIELNGYSYRFDFDTNPFLNKDITREDVISMFEKWVTNKEIELRDYQLESVYLAIRKMRGIVLNATGSGKALCIYLLTRHYYSLNQKILIIVPNVNLVLQLKKEFIEYGWDDVDDHVAIFHGKIEKDFTKPIIISTYQTLMKIENSDFFESFESVIIDECQKCKAISLETILKRMINSKNRIGFSGSLHPSLSDKFKTFGFLGPTLIETTSRELQDRGILSKLKINLVRIDYPEEEREALSGNEYRTEQQYILYHPKRNNVLKMIFSKIDSKDNTIIFFHELDHLNMVKKYLEKEFPDKKIFVMDGSVDSEDREDIRSNMESEEGCILLGTIGVIGVGLNVRRLHHALLYSSTKSSVAVIQLIGRLLRRLSGKNGAMLWDIIDNLTWGGETNYFVDHGKERLKIYKDQKFDDIAKIVWKIE